MKLDLTERLAVHPIPVWLPKDLKKAMLVGINFTSSVLIHPFDERAMKILVCEIVVCLSFTVIIASDRKKSFEISRGMEYPSTQNTCLQ